LRPDELEEDEVDDFGHVDSGIEHIDRDRDVRRLRRNREAVDQALRILDREIDQACEFTFVLGVILVETFRDEYGVRVILRENDGFAETISTSHLLTSRHQMLKHLVDRVLVEEPFVYSLRFDAIRNLSFLAPL